jgi:hypothetical protein
VLRRATISDMLASSLLFSIFIFVNIDQKNVL